MRDDTSTYKTPAGVRDSQRELMAEKRAKERDIEIPAVADRARRARAEQDVYYFLPTYFEEKYCHPFTSDRREIVSAILHCAMHGGDQSVAAPRGEGKTTLAEGVIQYAMLMGMLRFPLIVAATGPHASRILSNIKFEFETNELLAADFPEVCVPIRALEGAPQRANMQTVDGARTMVKWAQDYVIFPNVRGSKAAGSVLATAGLDGAIRGVRYRNRRPDFVLVDDPETRESAASDLQTQKRELIIEQDLAGVGGPGNRIARVMLCTIMNQRCLAQKFTDRMEKPSWNGKRLRLLVERPEREDLWENYIAMRQEGQSRPESPDVDGREANQFYLDNRDAMDAGAVVSNPHRFIGDPASDGSPLESSALQHIYNIICDRGWNNFATEYQNDPPEEDAPEESGITATIVQKSLTGLPRGVIPRGAIAVTAGIDVGKRALHYTVIAWMAQAVGYVIDYGVQDVHNADAIGVEPAIDNALKAWRDTNLEAPYVTEDGEPRAVDRILVDSGNWDTAVHGFVRNAGMPYRSSKGFGQSEKSPFATPSKPGPTLRIGDHWYEKHQPTNGIWLLGFDADHWKRWLHDRYMTATTMEDGSRRPGSIAIFGEDWREHTAYGHHIVAEVEIEEFIKGKGLKRFFRKRNPNNHWLDSTVMACVGGCCAGVTLQERPAHVARPRRRIVSNVAGGDGWVGGGKRWL